MKKIKQIDEFAKLYKLNIPVPEHFEYYIQTLSNSYEFRDIVSLVNEYSDFEEWLEKHDFHNVGHYKMNNVFEILKKHILESAAYGRCQNFDYSETKFFEKDHLKMYEGNYMLSLDFSSANFQSVKIFDDENVLKSSWEELCSSMHIHPMISRSKSFRQLVFGNLNPKRFQKIHHHYMIKLVDELSSIFPPENIIFVSHDELVMNLGNEESVASERVLQIEEVVKLLKEKRVSNGDIWLDVKPTIFKMNKISKGIYVKAIYTLIYSIKNKNKKLVQLYKTLFGCPGNMYYMNFKEHILEEGIEDRDCLFVLENRIAKWML